MLKVIIIFLLAMANLYSSSCTTLKHVAREKLKSSKIKYELTDKSGKFLLIKEIGFQKNSNGFVVKKTILPGEGDDKKVLEKSITISIPGRLNGKINVLRPKISQSTIWLDGEKYFTQLKTNVERKSIEIKTSGPQKEWDAVKEVPFPSGTGVFCYYNQLVECIKTTDFIEKAYREGVGQMNLHVIWDSYPFFQQQYNGLPNELFTRARFEYDGRNEDGENRFSLDIGGQLVFYFLDDKGNFIKQFWVTQGLSVVRSQFQ